MDGHGRTFSESEILFLNTAPNVTASVYVNIFYLKDQSWPKKDLRMTLTIMKVYCSGTRMFASGGSEETLKSRMRTQKDALKFSTVLLCKLLCVSEAEGSNVTLQKIWISEKKKSLFLVTKILHGTWRNAWQICRECPTPPAHLLPQKFGSTTLQSFMQNQSKQASVRNRNLVCAQTQSTEATLQSFYRKRSGS